MSVATMTPPTPPKVDGQELQEGFHHLLQHTTRNQPQPNAYVYDNGSYIPGPPAPFTNPEPEQGAWFVDNLGNQNLLYHDQANRGGEIQFVSSSMGLMSFEKVEH